MLRFALIALALTLGGSAYAQTNVLPEIGIQNSGSCRNITIRDRTNNALVPIGCIDTTTHTFTPVGGGVTNSAVLGALGYTPSNKAGDTFSGSMTFSRAMRMPTVGALDTTYSGPFPTSGPDNAIMAAAGNQISFCPSFSCPTNSPDHQRASLLVAATTQDDGHSEEQTVAITTINNKGYTTTWAASTSYANGANVQNLADNNNSVYRQVSGSTCTSGSTAPVGKTAGIVDNSCRWDWINDSAVNAKVGLYNEIGCMPGGGACWAQANNAQMAPGNIPYFVINTEFDLFNNSGHDCTLGAYNCNNLYIYTGGPNKSTTAVAVFSGNTDTWGAYWGIRLSGPKAFSDVDIAVDTTAAVGLGFGVTGLQATPTHSDATIKDATTSPIGYRDLGSHSIGIALNGTYSGLQIGGNGWNVNPSGIGTFAGVSTPGAVVGSALNSSGAVTGATLQAPIHMMTPTTYAQYACNTGNAGMTRFINDGNITPSGNYWAVVSGGGPYYGVVVCDSLNWRWH